MRISFVCNRFIDDDAELDIHSGSVEDDTDDASSEESSASYEHIPHDGPPSRNYPYPPRYPPYSHHGYRRGKSLKNKNKAKLADTATTKGSVNGTIQELTITDASNVTRTVNSTRSRSSRIIDGEKTERHAFLARKTRELNVVN
jgi:hypothetical protein